MALGPATRSRAATEAPHRQKPTLSHLQRLVDSMLTGSMTGCNTTGPARQCGHWPSGSGKREESRWWQPSGPFGQADPQLGTEVFSFREQLSCPRCLLSFGEMVLRRR